MEFIQANTITTPISAAEQQQCGRYCIADVKGQDAGETGGVPAHGVCQLYVLRWRAVPSHYE